MVAAAATIALLIANQGAALVTPVLDPIALPPGETAGYDGIGRLAQERGGGPLIELPVTGRDGVDLRPRAMLGELHHRQPLINGFSGHLPAHFLVINNRTQQLPDPGAVADLVDVAHLRFLLLRPIADWESAEERERFRTALLAIPGTSATDVDGFVLVELQTAPRHPRWFDAVASGRGFGDLPLDELRHLEPWEMRDLAPQPSDNTPAQPTSSGSTD